VSTIELLTVTYVVVMKGTLMMVKVMIVRFVMFVVRFVWVNLHFVLNAEV
jgi:hypothetical protein